LVAELAARCRELEGSEAAGGQDGQTRKVPDTPAGEAGTDGGLGTDLILTLANSLFRLERNLVDLEAGAPDSRELRSLRRAHERIEAALREHGVEWRDLCGEIYDVGRLDFERLGPSIAKVGLDRDRIGRCERPIVLLRGQLLQTARGVVETPLSEPSAH
jgi:hypothetical protein